MEIEKALDEGARITYQYRWVCGYDGEYTVYERRPYQKKTRVLEAGVRLSFALEKLLEDD